jgi:hypothetical protein
MEGQLAPTLAGIREEGEGDGGVKRLNIGLSTDMWVLCHIVSSFAIYMSILGWRGKNVKYRIVHCKSGSQFTSRGRLVPRLLTKIIET